MDRSAPALTAPALGALPACRFGRFALQPAERRLWADGKPVSLGARAFDLLVVLVARAGRLVSKNELITLVWSGLVVEENNLQVQVSALRKLLGPSALATIPGRGYRFELPVERGVERESGEAAAGPVAAPEAQEGPRGVPAEAAASTHRAPTNIPQRLSSLYGRNPDLDAVKALLARHVVVTIAGAGGIGKTRVAQAVAGQLAVERAADFPDGVWWVELAPLADSALVAPTVARVLDTHLGADRPPVETLADVLAPQRLLLVLDNCEHLTATVATLIEALCAAAPGLRVLVTSQETLRSAEEQVYRLGALAVPDGASGGDPLHSGAVELFVARAQAADPRFALTAQNTAAVVEICRRLDGIPLAIELAAARVPLLGVEGLRTRLDERFSILTAGARVVLRRHQTLRATLEWSHAHLTADEQTVFRRLGVFAGSFTLESAQYVVHDAQIDEWSALDHLGALVDKSLVLAEGDPVPRYRLLETTRAYALERLGEAGETRSTVRRHAEALLRLLRVFDAEDLAAPTTPAGWRAGGAEIDNLRAALTWAATVEGSEDLAIALAGGSYRIWCGSWQMREGMERCLALRDHLHDGVPSALVARFWLAIAQLGTYSSRREFYDAAQRAVDLHRKLGDRRRLFDALLLVAAHGIRFGSVEDMGEAIAEAAELVQPDWPVTKRAMLEFARSRWYARQGRIEESLAAAERQSAIALQGGNELGSLYAISNVAAAEHQLGRTEVALAHARNAIARLEELGAGGGAGHLWLGVAQGEATLRNIDAAIEACRTAYALLLREDDQLRVFGLIGWCAALQGRLNDAARIEGYWEAAFARTGARRELHWSRVSDELGALLARMPADERARLRAEGAAMKEGDVVRLALGDAA